MNLKRHIDQLISQAMVDAGLPAADRALVAQSAKAQFGDYQANGVMAGAKKLKTNPRQLAEKVVEAANLSDIAQDLEVAGPGFINITLKNEFLAEKLSQLLDDERMGVALPEKPQTVVVDYSGPNLAKEMHVGHLRSTIIGDALARVLDFVGHKVIRQNHVGDWGTQFGMLTAMMEEIDSAADADTGQTVQLNDLEEFYRRAKERFDSDEAFSEKARQYVVKLQSGDEQVHQKWTEYAELSLKHCQEIYSRLGVSLRREDVRGESQYNDDLSAVVADLDQRKMLTESQGAKCVFVDEFKDKEGNVLPVIVQKSDGGYLYATTDLAALRYRSQKLRADRILYVTDSRQALHFRQVFTVARQAQFVRDDISLEHVPFGMMLGGDHKPFRTRDGKTIKLLALLDQASQRARELVEQKNPDMPDEQKDTIAKIVGIGSVKYADLSQNRASDYVFSWDKMLSLDGNTAPYMQYAYARIRSIFRKDTEKSGQEKRGLSPSSPGTVPFFPAHFSLDHPAERTLGIKLLQFPEAVQAISDQCQPNILCEYLFDLAGAFMAFYESCPVLKAQAPTRASRLSLCELTARTIKTGLQLLGIKTLEKM